MSKNNSSRKKAPSEKNSVFVGIRNPKYLKDNFNDLRTSQEAKPADEVFFATAITAKTSKSQVCKIS